MYLTEMLEIPGDEVGYVDRRGGNLVLLSRTAVTCWTLRIYVKPPIPQQRKATNLKTESWVLSQGRHRRGDQRHGPFFSLAYKDKLCYSLQKSKNSHWS